MEPQENNILKKGTLGLLAIGIIAGLTLYLSQDKNKSEESREITATEKTSEPQVLSQKTETVATLKSISTYKDGTYQAPGSYSSPAGKENVVVSLTLANDIVTAATFKGEATHPASKNWQGKFAEGFNQEVIGKKIDGLSLTVVNGSSLTPKGFMDALSVIKTEAKI